MTLTTLVTGNNANAREAAIAKAITPGVSTTLILEGITASDPLTPTSSVRIIRIAAGCPCCSGNLTMRVMLNRVLRHPPQQLFISLASAAHLEQFKQFLRQPPYDNYLTLTPDLPS